jgi:hypothetical protein
MISRPVRHIFLVPVLVALTATFGHAGDPPWRMMESPRFTMISQRGDQPTRAWAGQFNQFHADAPHGSMHCLCRDVEMFVMSLRARLPERASRRLVNRKNPVSFR